MYNKYMQICSVPAGVILNRIIKEKNIQKKDIASKIHIPPQRISDLISGSRRFSPELSLQLEGVLNIPIHGFFYKIQTNHDIYTVQLKHNPKPDTQKLSQATFWDTNIDKIDWSLSKSWAIRRVLEYGSKDELRVLSDFYGKESIIREASHKDYFRLYNNVLKQIETL